MICNNRKLESHLWAMDLLQIAISLFGFGLSFSTHIKETRREINRAKLAASESLEKYRVQNTTNIVALRALTIKLLDNTLASTDRFHKQTEDYEQAAWWAAIISGIPASLGAFIIYRLRLRQRTNELQKTLL